MPAMMKGEAKEAALREREEAIRIAQQVLEQNKLLKNQLHNEEMHLLKMLNSAFNMNLITQSVS